MKRPEILSPAGNLEKLNFAIRYGADAVYAAGENFGLRGSAGNFSDKGLATAIDTAHAAGKKIYIAINIFPYNNDIEPIKNYLSFLSGLKVDAVIISDLGVLSLVKEAAPGIPVHVSVQANNLNYREVKMWQSLGAKRAVLARELPFEDIKMIRQECPDMELEVFVHGAICISLSGRCLLSSYMTGRDANRGECAQSCRWSYKLIEEKRPGEEWPATEDSRGTYIFNSKDLCAIRELHKFIEIGIDSFKIEGRMKSGYYAAVTAYAYKNAVEQYMANPAAYKFDKSLFDELLGVSHREYTDGLYFPGKDVTQDFKTSDYTSAYDYCGYIMEVKEKDGYLVDVKKTLKLNGVVEVLTPQGRKFQARIRSIINKQGVEETYTKQYETYLIAIDSAERLTEYSILRQPANEKIA